MSIIGSSDPISIAIAFKNMPITNLFGAEYENSAGKGFTIYYETCDHYVEPKMIWIQDLREKFYKEVTGVTEWGRFLE